MDLTLTLILGISLYGIILLVYVLSANQRVPKKNIILGVTVPHAQHESPQVAAITASYIKRLRLFALVSILLGFPLVFLSASWQIMLLMCLLLLVIAGDLVIYVRAHRSLAALKRQENWQGDAPRPTSVADIKAMEEKKRPIPRILFILPCLVTAVPLIPLLMQFAGGDADWSAVLTYGLTAVWVPLLLILAEAIRRQNAEIVGAVSDLNVIATRVRRREYLRCMLLVAWFMAVICLFIWFQDILVQSHLILMPAILILSIVVVIYTIRAEFAVRRVQERFTKIAGDSLEVDDDKFWLWGMLYYNREDRRFLIKDRIGINMTFNLGRPAGLVILLASALLLLLLPLFGLWVVAQEESPIHYAFEDNSVIVTHVWTQRFDLGENWEAELLDSFPYGGVRTFGTSVGTLRSGRFTLPNIGPCYVLLHTDRLPLIKITTEDGQIYLFNYDPVFTPLLAQ